MAREHQFSRRTKVGAPGNSATRPYMTDAFEHGITWLLGKRADLLIEANSSGATTFSLEWGGCGTSTGQ